MQLVTIHSTASPCYNRSLNWILFRLHFCCVWLTGSSSSSSVETSTFVRWYLSHFVFPSACFFLHFNRKDVFVPVLCVLSCYVFIGISCCYWFLLIVESEAKKKTRTTYECRAAAGASEKQEKINSVGSWCRPTEEGRTQTAAWRDRVWQANGCFETLARYVAADGCWAAWRHWTGPIRCRRTACYATQRQLRQETQAVWRGSKREQSVLLCFCRGLCKRQYVKLPTNI